jgi:hypothetical protein
VKDSISRVIDDLETKLEQQKKLQQKMKTEVGHFTAEGMIVANEYAIQELRKVLSDHG